MNRNSIYLKKRLAILFFPVLNILASTNYSSAQTTPILGDPAKCVYGLTQSGQIFEIDITNGATNKTIKNASYTGNAPAGANGIGYNVVNGKFYYFKNNSNSSLQEFVSFDPKTGIVSALAKSTITSSTVTGCVSYDGKGYYTMDTYGALSYYNIASNTWKLISTEIADEYGNDVDSLAFERGSGDIAIDGFGNLWIVVSGWDQFGVYKIAGPAPTNSVSQINASRVIAPTTATPNAKPINGIAFCSNGQIFMATMDDKLYTLQNANTLTFIANLPEAGEGADLTSQNFPTVVLPVTWISMDALAKNNTSVTLNWKVMEYENKGFYIQHSVDGETWGDIDFIKSRSITQSEQIYSYTYIASLSGIQYYRIRQVDIDGKESFSAIRVLNFNADSSTIAIWPNPARNSLYIDNKSSGNAMATRVQLYDFSGKLNIDKKLQAGTNIIDISSLPFGTYIISATTGNGNLFTRKIVKQ